MTPAATIVITSKNRKDDLRNAIRSALAQEVAAEVLVIDDGSTDGTSDMIEREFPAVRLERSETSLGLIVQRNRAGEMASAPVIFSIDDDAIFPSPRTVGQTLGEFDHPRIGAIAIPYVDVKYGSRVFQQAPAGDDPYVVSEYRGTAHAIRRDVFDQVGGYRAYYFHQGEEGEYCLRMLNAGYVTRLGRADPIHHFESPNRDRTRMYHYSARNNILFAWYDVPLPFMPMHAAATTFNVLRDGWRSGYFLPSVHGAARGYTGMWHERRHRRAVLASVYRLHRRLKKGGPLPLPEIAHLLPPLDAEAQPSPAPSGGDQPASGAPGSAPNMRDTGA